ncbi:hypothetical protein EYF80_062374 [Liparis tanakae]|uniref:Uncharacterized protein n=1 Tax=Liparis tanakae TaxID=230148 RepID=A0A4Z2EGM9_9TELE|nr:hypothetical protein EYF80_062374 [Liparis tanakae]
MPGFGSQPDVLLATRCGASSPPGPPLGRAPQHHVHQMSSCDSGGKTLGAGNPSAGRLRRTPPDCSSRAAASPGAGASGSAPQDARPEPESRRKNFGAIDR